MKTVLIVVNHAAYGSEMLFNALRIAISVRTESDNRVRLFLMSDAVTAVIKQQTPPEGYNIQQMFEILSELNAEIAACKSCTDARGISHTPILENVNIVTLDILTQWIIEADNVLTF